MILFRRKLSLPAIPDYFGYLLLLNEKFTCNLTNILLAGAKKPAPGVRDTYTGLYYYFLEPYFSQIADGQPSSPFKD